MKRRHPIRLIAAVLTLPLGSVQADPKAGDGPAAGSPDLEATAATCRACHTGPMSLAGRPADDLATSIRAIVAGERPHPPVTLPDDGDATVQALAKRLTLTDA